MLSSISSDDGKTSGNDGSEWGQDDEHSSEMEDGKVNGSRSLDLPRLYTNYNKEARPVDRGSEAQLCEAWLD